MELTITNTMDDYVNIEYYLRIDEEGKANYQKTFLAVYVKDYWSYLGVIFVNLSVILGFTHINGHLVHGSFLRSFLLDMQQAR